MTSLQLHADALAIPVDTDRVQLRVPDGQHLTFDQAVDDLLRAFDLLRGGTGREELEAVLGFDLAAELVDLLTTRGLVQDGVSDRSQFSRLLDQHLAVGGRLMDGDPPRSVAVVGAGRVANLIRDALEAEDGADGKAYDPAGILLVVASDSDDIDALLIHNARAVTDGRPITFIRWDQRRLIVGPFVVPGETACLDCAAHRQRAASLHVDELLAWRSSSKRHPRFEGGEVLDAFVTAVAIRHIRAILAGANAVAAAGAISMVDPVSLESVTAPIVRLPRCPTCRPSEDRPRRSVRDLN